MALYKTHQKERLLLILGDACVFVFSLWLTLIIRYGEFPSGELFSAHLFPFLFIFASWMVVFFIAGLYEKHTLIFQKNLSTTIIKAHVVNSALAAIFFYVVPFFVISPKTNLFLDLILSFALIFFWRQFCVNLISTRKPQNAVLIGAGKEMQELISELGRNRRYGLHFTNVINLDQQGGNVENGIENAISSLQGVEVVVANLYDSRTAPSLSRLYQSLFSEVEFVEFSELYEDIFDRVPLSLLTYRWFLENVSASRKAGYDLLKRIMDIFLSIPVGIIFCIFFPFVWIALKLEDGGPVFSIQERVGQGAKRMMIYKFRTMDGDYRGGWVHEKDRRVTRVGKFLRKTRIDEFPQFWNVLRGDISFIGPRPDVIGNYEHLVEELPYYRVRSVVKPGLSGWAQIKQALPPQSLEETRLRLAYDFYYIKNRSIVLDIQIALQTLKTLISRLGV